MKIHLVTLAVILCWPCLLWGIFWGQKSNFSPVPVVSEAEPASYNPLVLGTLGRCEQAGAGPGNGFPPPHALVLANVSWEFSSATTYTCSEVPYCGGLICITSLAGWARSMLMHSLVNADLGGVWAEQLYKEIERLETQDDNKMRFGLGKSNWNN